MEPVTLTWPDGSTVALSREGGLVTAVVTPANPNTLPFGAQDLPAEFAPLGNAYYFGYASLPTAGPGRYIVQIIEDGESAVVAGFVATGDPPPYAPFTAQWAADPTDTVPEAVVRVVARMVARVFSQTASSDALGSEATTEAVGPFSRTVRFASGTTSGAPWLTASDKITLRPYRCGGGMQVVALSSMQTGRYRRYP